jgi:DMSO/TMAO reductase YedYZ molybdopterin-dependent catalytic subunit
MARPHLWNSVAGLLAAALALAVAELVAGLLGTTSLVVAVGDYVVDYSPGSVTKSVIDVLGTKDKSALLLLIVVSSLGIGALLGPAAARRPNVGPVAFVVFAIAGTLAGARLPENGVVTTLLVAVAAAVAGVVALRLLLAAAPAASDEAVSEIELPSEDSRGSRREFFRLAGTIGGVAAVSAVVGRQIIGPRVDVEAARRAIVLPAAAISNAPVQPGSQPVAASDAASGAVSGTTSDAASGATFEIDGLATLITPNDEFYRIDTALVVPRVDVESWRLRVTGMVERPIELSFEDLLAMPAREETVTLACVSNEVGGDLVGNAVWLGIPLADVLARAGVLPDATQIIARSVDRFTVGFPTEVALDGRPSMVAIGMNGEPLPAAHGFPARIIIPGLYGYVSATKWLGEIELTTLEDFDAYWIRRGWSKRAPIKTQSRIDVPRAGRTIDPGRAALAGVAWGGLRSISAVKVRVTRSGEPSGEWREASLSEALSQSSWRQWYVEWDATPGEYRIQVRATDGDSETQTADRARPAPDGATGYHEIKVRVRDA